LIFVFSQISTFYLESAFASFTKVIFLSLLIKVFSFLFIDFTWLIVIFFIAIIFPFFIESFFYFPTSTFFSSLIFLIFKVIRSVSSVFIINIFFTFTFLRLKVLHEVSLHIIAVAAFS